jgi:hypothetical protein
MSVSKPNEKSYVLSLLTPKNNEDHDPCNVKKGIDRRSYNVLANQVSANERNCLSELALLGTRRVVARML